MAFCGPSKNQKDENRWRREKSARGLGSLQCEVELFVSASMLHFQAFLPVNGEGPVCWCPVCLLCCTKCDGKLYQTGRSCFMVWYQQDLSNSEEGISEQPVGGWVINSWSQISPFCHHPPESIVLGSFTWRNKLLPISIHLSANKRSSD